MTLHRVPILLVATLLSVGLVAPAPADGQDRSRLRDPGAQRSDEDLPDRRADARERRDEGARPERRLEQRAALQREADERRAAQASQQQQGREGQARQQQQRRESQAREQVQRRQAQARDQQQRRDSQVREQQQRRQAEDRDRRAATARRSSSRNVARVASAWTPRHGHRPGNAKRNSSASP